MLYGLKKEVVMTLTEKKLNERKKYIQKKMKWSDIYTNKVFDFLLKGELFNVNTGYCGRGNDNCKQETISSFLVPDFKSKNFSCFVHDQLYNAIEINLISKELADKFFLYSMLFDAGYNPFKRISSHLYYRSVCLVDAE